MWEDEVVGADAGARCSGFRLGKHVGMRHAAVGSTCQADGVGATGYEPSCSRQTNYLRQMICVFPQKACTRGSVLVLLHTEYVFL